MRLVTKCVKVPSVAVYQEKKFVSWLIYRKSKSKSFWNMIYSFAGKLDQLISDQVVIFFSSSYQLNLTNSILYWRWLPLNTVSDTAQ